MRQINHLSLAEAIRSLREQKRWSQEKLGQLCGVSREYIKSIERGENKHPRTDKLLKLAKVLEYPKQELYRVAGYLNETDIMDDKEESPQQIINRIKLDLIRLEKALQEEEASKDQDN